MSRNNSRSNFNHRRRREGRVATSLYLARSIKEEMKSILFQHNIDVQTDGIQVGRDDVERLDIMLRDIQDHLNAFRALMTQQRQQNIYRMINSFGNQLPMQQQFQPSLNYNSRCL